MGGRLYEQRPTMLLVGLQLSCSRKMTGSIQQNEFPATHGTGDCQGLVKVPVRLYSRARLGVANVDSFHGFQLACQIQVSGSQFLVTDIYARFGCDYQSIGTQGKRNRLAAHDPLNAARAVLRFGVLCRRKRSPLHRLVRASGFILRLHANTERRRRSCPFPLWRAPSRQSVG